MTKPKAANNRRPATEKKAGIILRGPRKKAWTPDSLADEGKALLEKIGGLKALAKKMALADVEAIHIDGDSGLKKAATEIDLFLAKGDVALAKASFEKTRPRRKKSLPQAQG